MSKDKQWYLDQIVRQQENIDQLQAELDSLRNFLKAKIAITKVSADNENYTINITIKEALRAMRGG